MLHFPAIYITTKSPFSLIHTYIHTYIHTNIHTYIHTNIHTYLKSVPCTYLKSLTANATHETMCTQSCVHFCCHFVDLHMQTWKDKKRACVHVCDQRYIHKFHTIRSRPQDARPYSIQTLNKSKPTQTNDGFPFKYILTIIIKSCA